MPIFPFERWPSVQRDYWPTEQWKTAETAKFNVNRQRIEAAIAYAGSHLEHIHSIVVVSQGYIIGERYYPGSDRTHIHRLHSISSLVATALVGIALTRHYFKSLDQTLGTILPMLEPVYQRLTLRQLLQMDTGITWNTAERYKEIDITWQPHEDWIQAASQQPPTPTFSFASPATQFLTLALKYATGQDVQRFADTALFQPIGIRNWVWERDKRGEPLLHVGLSLTARDTAKIGFLYLNRGWWDAKRLFPAAYAVASMEPHVQGLWPHHLPYGYGWWITRIGNHHVFFTAGFGEQFLYIIPGLDVVIALTGSDVRLAPSYKEHRTFIEQWLVPAIISQ